MTYTPGRDSYLLKQHVEEKNLEGKKILDMGTGSGIIAVTAADRGAEVLAVDSDPRALKDAEKSAGRKQLEGKIEFRRSDLFENVEEKYDYIFFNPPYLPGERFEDLDGGEKGIETTEKFLQEAPNHLKESGEAVFLASSRSEVSCLENKFDIEKVRREKLWFETLYLFKMS